MITERRNHRLRNFSCFDQLITMVSVHLTNRENLRDIETCLRTQKTKLRDFIRRS
ncbi:MAG: DUF4372 domain-containing protein [Candidatus Riflebacteria bacterium]|nr:DUF4372 domain-containing protein [Candidatus Riflebacteria bacterium]